METTTNEIRIYVACLAAYNNGTLHGSWINASQDAWEIWNEVSAMLKDSPIEEAEEWAIHDYEGFQGVTISEWEGFERVSEPIWLETLADTVNASENCAKPFGTFLTDQRLYPAARLTPRSASSTIIWSTISAI